MIRRGRGGTIRQRWSGAKAEVLSAAGVEAGEDASGQAGEEGREGGADEGADDQSEGGPVAEVRAVQPEADQQARRRPEGGGEEGIAPSRAEQAQHRAQR